MATAPEVAPAVPPERRPARRRPSWPAGLLIGLSVVLLAAVAGLTIERGLDDRARQRDAAGRRAIEIAGALAAQAGQSIAAVDAVLEGIVDAIRVAGAAERDEAIVAVIRRRVNEGSHIRDLAVLDEAGQVRFVAGELAMAASGTRLQDLLSAERGAGAPWFLAPLGNAGQGPSIVTMGRRIESVDGSEAGAVVAFVPADELRPALRGSADRPDEAIALWSADGMLLSRSRSPPAGLGQTLAEASMRRSLASGPELGVLTTRSPIDGERRTVGWAAVSPYPFFVSFTLNERASLGDWWSGFAPAIALAAVAGLALAGVSVFLMLRLHTRSTAEATQFAEEGRLRDFVAAASDWSWEQDDSLRFTAVESRGIHSGADLQRLIGRTLRECAGGQEEHGRWDRYDALVSARLPFRNLRIQLGDASGGMRKYALSGVPAFGADGGFRGYRGIGRDVTEESEANDTLRAVIDAVPAMISAKDTAGRFVFMNSYQASLYGTTSEAALGATATEILGAIAGSHAGALDRRVIETGAPTGFFEERFTGADGIIRDWLSAKIPIRAGNGQVRLVLTVSMDITAQKVAEKQLRHAHSEIVRAKETAEQASLAKSEFLANVSHELRTPLNAIIGFSEIMAASMYGPIGSERYAGYVHDIHHSALFLLDLINDILDMAKIEAGKRELTLEAVDVSAEIKDTARMFAQRAAQEEIALVRDLPAGPVTVEADRRAIRQILINVVGNAVKFSPRGRAVKVTLSRTDSGVSITVRDEGCGIPPDQIERLGTPFFQVNDYAARSKPGSGLGLALTKSLLALHGGSLAIDSEVGRGTTVVIYLPNAPAATTTSATTAA